VNVVDQELEVDLVSVDLKDQQEAKETKDHLVYKDHLVFQEMLDY